MTTRFPVLLALTIGMVVQPTARADNLDDALLKAAPEVLRFVKDRNYRNVGVLKFRAQNGNQPLSFRVGPINTNLAIRLENALVLKNDRKQPVGIIHDPSMVAQARRLPSYSTDAGMAKLFQQRFPLAWESPPVYADAFLTGTIRAAANMKTATVTIQAFTNKATKLDQVTSFTVPVDRSLLNDLAQGFSLSSRSMKLKKTRALDLEASDDAAQRDKTPPAPDTPDPLPSAEKLVDFEIRYDGRPQPYTADPKNGGEAMVAEPIEGQRVTFVLRGRAPERVGVVVMVNGKNSLFEQEKEPINCSMWLPGPGQVIEIKGFQVDQKTIKPFRVLSPAESEAMAYTDNLGKISVYVFRSMKGKTPDTDPPDKVTPGSKDSELTVTGSRNLRDRGTASSLKKRQEQLGAPSKGKSRGVIGSESTRENYEIEYFEFNNPEQQQALVIRYYNPKRR